MISGRRSTTPCSSIQRVLYQVPKISRPLIAETGQVLEDQGLGDVDLDRSRAGIPNSTTRPPFRTIWNASSIAGGRAGHLEDDVEVLALVPGEEPAGVVVDAAEVERVVCAHPLGEAEPERRTVGGEHPAGAGGARDRRC